MRAIHFDEANTIFEKPNGMTDEECLPVSAYVGKNQTGQTYINVVYMPSKEDIEAILAGRPIVASFCSSILIPHSLFTFDEAGKINE